MKTESPIYHVSMSDRATRNFCDYMCTMMFQNQFSKKPLDLNGSFVPTGIESEQTQFKEPTMPVVSNVKSLAPNTTSRLQMGVIIKTSAMPEVKNKMTMCKPVMVNQTTNTTKASTASKGCQTDELHALLMPIPVPIYVPVPLPLYTAPYPSPTPIPLPVPVPVLIPTTRKSDIFKQIRETQAKINNPDEAELLTIADVLAGGSVSENTSDSGSESVSSSFADELDKAIADFQADLIANAVSRRKGEERAASGKNVEEFQQIDSKSLKKRTGNEENAQIKRGRSVSPNVSQQPSEIVQRADANMFLKYTFGVNAWKQWVASKNAELKRSCRGDKLVKSEILQLTADELNYYLCLFVREVRKPNGEEYAPDTIYYLCLGIQQYLFENGRCDNLFCDSYYAKFSDCFDEVVRKFPGLYRDSNYIVTRVEEEHLWESRQLGAHSPQVLLNTLMFFSTKFFGFSTVDEHMQLSFSHLIEHYCKCDPNQPRSKAKVALRFYPPQSAANLFSNSRKEYKLPENKENRLRCPVKLHEFYLSKCPESVKTRNDRFYLLPERYCTSDSPVWYSTDALPRESLEKMLNRIKVVKEVNVAFLNNKVLQ